MFKKSVFVLIFIATFGHFCFGQNLAELEANIDSLLDHIEAPSIAIAVVKNGDIVYEKAFGYANLEKMTNSTIHTPYQLASLTKPITATAILKLHQQGLIDLDDPITQYIALKKVDGSFKDPTIRQVLNHTSGLGTYFEIYYADESVNPLTFGSAWEQYGTQFHEPGQVCEYSNLGYGLLDSLISQKTVQNYASYLQLEVFDPLGMKNAFVIERDNEKEVAQKYDQNGKPLPFIWNNTPGAGNVAASVHDIIRFADFHLQNLKGGDLLNPTLLQEMQKNQDPNALYHYYQDTYYGLGWYVMPNDRGQQVIWHEGGMMGASTTLKLFPRENLAIAILINTYAPEICRSLSDAIASTIIPDYQPTALNETAEYRTASSDTSFMGLWEGQMYIEAQEIPISLTIHEEALEISYIDAGFSSFLTDYQPLPYSSKLLFGAVNQEYFIGTGIGDLPASDVRKQYPHLLSLKLYKTANTLKGTLINMAAAQREYYAHPYYIELKKQRGTKLKR